VKYLRGLRIDWEYARGEVQLDPEFQNLIETNGLLKADVLNVLRDWIEALVIEYAKAIDLPVAHEVPWLSHPEKVEVARVDVELDDGQHIWWVDSLEKLG
jgi:hypothetical protein